MSKKGDCDDRRRDPEEETRKKIGFILERQAQFAINRDLLGEAQKRTEAHLSEVAVAQVQMGRSQAHMNEVVAVMAEAQERTDRKLAVTSDRLNTLIDVVERYNQRTPQWRILRSKEV